ncbi:hypothetical protein CcaverHIS002_0702650 [Cutaneotrichosporon cavernicola]|uniref:Nuclear pore complex protein n=1 Tax=Cutaneotrichosporon cavernicola TaxID=279322 RepID=A0AA48L9Z1_9TREE|nr:uncharacterized protein CcaverHIS019_0702730 [Cutaneotrichosporon cavernicola]BEI86919.1 hypothetical protein CcaverHIS002_0702650 [Cutaneotrichosporon cavernicola]BEI94692.1 hypothetical protein CcaverHIS019_0702730 [Cutaneotrichosporon cavernicola]BEJ02467.1 hypothetical protein CcaverHIS631_0702620 [Cutaneotrichosporon cavernicola]BEJ10226.1 hypothetical protein CcaverHIS641_0702610 [Cutaneotrichosporon cavernicola]
MTGTQPSPYVTFEGILKRYHAAAGPSQLDGVLDADAVLNDETGLLVQLQGSLESYLRANGASAIGSGNLGTDEYKWLVLEHRTWGLIRAVYENRLSPPPSGSAADTVAADPYITPMDLTQHIVSDDADLSLWATLVEHLQTRPLFSAPPPLEARHGYLPSTVRRTKTAKLTGSNEGSLDPDFTLRGGTIAGEDGTYATPLLETLFDLVRHGELDHAVHVCEEGGEPWRAASIMGGRRWDMGGFTTERSELTAMSGNRSRALWKKACRAIAKNATLSSAERALYAALVSDLSTLLPACEGWEDQLWAHVAARLESRIDARWHELGGFWQTEDPQTDDDQAVHGGLPEVFASIATQSGPVAEASRNPLCITQKQVLLDDAAAHLDTFADRLPTLTESVPEVLIGPLMRFFAHLVLVLRTLGQDVPESAANAILEAYLRVLEHGGYSTLVAPYAACLREGNGEESYARFLRSMPPTASLQDKRVALLRARDYGLDVATIATYTVRMILHAAFDAAPSLAPGQPDITDVRVSISPDDEALIRALEWLTIVPETLPEALARADEVARYFLATGQSNATGALLRSLPDDIGTGAADDEAEFADYVRLYEVFAAHDLAEEIASAPPKETASKVEQHAWSKRLLSAIERVADLTRNLLTSSWLAFPIADNGKQGNARRRELRRIRQIFVPDLVMRLHTLLVEHHTRFPQLLQDALDMTVLVASQEYHVYEEFIGRDTDASRLVAYLDHVREASMSALAAGSSDPFHAP